MRTFLASFCVLLLCMITAIDPVRAQGGKADKNPKYQDLMGKGNLSLYAKNYPQAIHFFELAVQLFPKDNPARGSLTKAQKAFQGAKDAYSKDMLKGRMALGKKDFKTAFSAFTTAAQDLPSDAQAVAGAQTYFVGATALQSAFNNLVANNYTDATKNYAKAFQVLGKDQHVQAPLREVRIALAEARNPTPYYAKEFKLGLNALDHGKFAEAKVAFKDALELPVDVADKERAQAYFDGTNALQRAFADLGLMAPPYGDAVLSFQLALVKLGKEPHAQKQLAKLKMAFKKALDAEIAHGNRYLKANDLDHAYQTSKKISILLAVFPATPAAAQFLTNFQNKAQLELKPALDSGSLDVTRFAATGNNFSSIKLAFQSAKLYTWFLKVPAGTIFQVRDNNFEKQNMILLHDTQLEIKPGTPLQIQPAAASMILRNDIPSTRVPMVLAATPTPKDLLGMVQAMSTAGLDFRPQQFAVWIVLNPSLKSTDMFVGSVPPSPQELAAVRTVFTRAGLDPQGYAALK